MTYPHEQILGGSGPETKDTRIVFCAGCGLNKAIRPNKNLHQEMDSGDMKFVLVPGLGWTCYECALRVYT